jgi:hypothetical protein
VAVIKKGKSHPDCEFGAIVALTKNDDGLILSHTEYQHNVAGVKERKADHRSQGEHGATSPRSSPEIEGSTRPSRSRNTAVDDGELSESPSHRRERHLTRIAGKQRVKIDPIIG